MALWIPHTLKGSMPGGDTALDDAMEVRELGSNPLTVLQLTYQNAPRQQTSTYRPKLFMHTVHIQFSDYYQNQKGDKLLELIKRLTFCRSKWYVESARTLWHCCL